VSEQSRELGVKNVLSEWSSAGFQHGGDYSKLMNIYKVVPGTALTLEEINGLVVSLSPQMIREMVTRQILEPSEQTTSISH
jgi:hypothetical protein